jgi:hypothetical protein
MQREPIGKAFPGRKASNDGVPEDIPYCWLGYGRTPFSVLYSYGAVFIFLTKEDIFIINRLNEYHL